MENAQTAKPIILTASLLIAALFFFIARLFPNASLWINIILLSIIDIGFIVAFILGIKTKIPSVIVFSVIANSVLFVLLSIFIFLLLLANGISER